MELVVQLLRSQQVSAHICIFTLEPVQPTRLKTTQSLSLFKVALAAGQLPGASMTIDYLTFVVSLWTSHLPNMLLVYIAS